MNSKNYKKWMEENLLPNILLGGIVLNDSAPCHMVQGRTTSSYPFSTQTSTGSIVHPLVAQVLKAKTLQIKAVLISISSTHAQQEGIMPSSLGLLAAGFPRCPLIH
jgi:hypothetical protein